MPTVAERIRTLRGWRFAGFCLVLGVASAAALPPLYFSPILLVVIPALIWLLDGAGSIRRAVLTGGLFGLGHFAGMIYWVANALMIDGGFLAVLAPLAVLGLSAVLALLPAFAFGVARSFWQNGPGRIFVFAAAWTGGELLREIFLTGFPWAPIGMTWMPFLEMIQATAVFGVTGLSLVTVLACGSLALLADRAPLKRRLPIMAGCIGVLIGVGAGGWLRLADHGGGQWDAQGRWLPAGQATDTAGKTPENGTALLRVRLVQPAIPQTQKWSATRLFDNIRTHITLSHLPGLEAVDAVIWSETAVPFALNVATDVRDAVKAAVPEGGVLITGSVRRGSGDGESSQVWNSLFVIDDRGAVVATYDKSHLVPFGEYVPVRAIPGVTKLTAGVGDFLAGNGPQTLITGLVPPFSPLICYEIIFPARVVADGWPRPRWIVNLTNDGWYGRSTGPYQHFQIARLRAVEEGISVVRVAGTGISGVISPLGEVSPTLGLNKAGILDIDVPPPLPFAPPFARFGNGIPVTAGLLTFLFGLLMCPYSNGFQYRGPR